MPCNFRKYPKNWKTEIRPRILKRAGNRCEFCGVANHTVNPETGGTVELSICHLDHDPANNHDGNLKCVCQKCHNIYDWQKRRHSSIKRRDFKLEAKGQYDVKKMLALLAAQSLSERDGFLTQSGQIDAESLI